jgi:alkanesulfonate monooxygenase SsuD/methylene tetrahydromethanopterin reductase-like flavin-dependent oxidoreductase (luciferase family)
MLSADPFVAMAAAAMKTTRIKLSTGVLIPSTASRQWPPMGSPR